MFTKSIMFSKIGKQKLDMDERSSAPDPGALDNLQNRFSTSENIDLVTHGDKNPIFH